MASRSTGEEQGEQPKVVQSAQRATYGLESSRRMVFPSQGHDSGPYKGAGAIGVRGKGRKTKDEPTFSHHGTQ